MRGKERLLDMNERTVFFVAETKSAGQESRVSEKRKIACGRAHFRVFDAVEFRQVSRVGDLD